MECFTKEQLDLYNRDGFVYIPAENMWSKKELDLLLSSVEEMESWPEKPFFWMKYFEKNKHSQRILQRLENFLDYNKPLDNLLNGNRFLNLVGELFGEEAILYKEKINYKLAGGNGFVPHQDASAGWKMYGQTLHISALISIDETTKENGALELVRGEHKKGLLGPEWKELPSELCLKWEKENRWETVFTKTGDVVFFDSFVPHRSGPNNTEKPRRVIYSTYAKKSEGDFRTKYYEDKRKTFPPDIERQKGGNYEYKV
jgi:ectoine hydroxylase-related dioxygenase (phytanoyl-CoA dioxygenase family)